MHAELIEVLQCPRCAGALQWHVDVRGTGRIVEGKGTCATCCAVYPVHDGVGVFVISEGRPPDPWGQSASGLLTYLREHPDVERALMTGPIERLAPADRYFRGHVLRLQGRQRESLAARRIADRGIYPAEYRAARDRMLDALATRARTRPGRLIDLASGEGTLVARLASAEADVVATDVSPSVLAGARERVRAEGADLAGALAFDARRTPFRDRSIPTLTTFMGLANIGLSDALLTELRRIVSGVLLAVELHFDPTDTPHVRATAAAGFAVHGRESWLEAFRRAGWDVSVLASAETSVRPTPRSELIPGAGIDGLPLRDTRGEWSLLEAR